MTVILAGMTPLERLGIAEQVVPFVLIVFLAMLAAALFLLVRRAERKLREPPKTVAPAVGSVARGRFAGVPATTTPEQKLQTLAANTNPKVICDGKDEYLGGSGDLATITKHLVTDGRAERRLYQSMLIRVIEALAAKNHPAPDLIYVGLYRADGETPLVHENRIGGSWGALSLSKQDTALRLTVNIKFEDDHWILSVPYDDVIEVALTREMEVWSNSHGERKTHKYQTLLIVLRGVQFSALCFAGHRCVEVYSALRSFLPNETTFRMT